MKELLSIAYLLTILTLLSGCNSYTLTKEQADANCEQLRAVTNNNANCIAIYERVEA